MSSTPNLPQIEQAIIDRIGTITAGVGSYNYTVLSTNIRRIAREITSVPPSSFPSVDIAYQGNQAPGYHPNHVWCTAQWLITGYVAISTGDESLAATERMLNCARLKDDLKAALMTSPALHGGVAVYAFESEHINSTAVDAERDSRGGVGTLRYLLNVVYQEPVGLTPTLA